MRTAVEKAMDDAAEAGNVAGLAKSIAAAEREQQQQIEDRMMEQVSVARRELPTTLFTRTVYRVCDGTK
jgi:hypothetical protein